MSTRAEIMKEIRQELERYPVIFAFGHGGKHPYVRIEAMDGKAEKVTYSETPRVANNIKVRGDLKRAIKRMGVAPYPDERKAARVGTLGAALIDAVEPATLSTDPKPAKEEPAMAAATVTPIKTAQQAPPPPARSYTKLTQSEIVQLTLLITQHAKIDYATKAVEYLDGWSDERLLEILRAAPDRAQLKLNHIKSFRTENFGLLKTEQDESEPTGRAVGGHVRTLKRQIGELTERVRALEEAITAPRA